VTGPVVEFQPHGGNRINEVDAGDPCLELRRWTVLVIPGEELSDGAGEQVGAGITEDRRVLVEGGFYVVASAGLGAIDVVLEHLGDCSILAHGLDKHLKYGLHNQGSAYHGGRVQRQSVNGTPDLPVRDKLIISLNPFNFCPLLFKFYLRRLDLLLLSPRPVLRCSCGYRRCTTCGHKDKKSTYDDQ